MGALVGRMGSLGVALPGLALDAAVAESVVEQEEDAQNQHHYHYLQFVAESVRFGRGFGGPVVSRHQFLHPLDFRQWQTLLLPLQS